MAIRNTTLLLITLGSIILTLIYGCHPENRVYIEHKDLSPGLEWLKSDSKEFQLIIEDNKIAYDLLLSFRYLNGYQYQTVDVKVTETSPNGTIRVKNHQLKVKDEHGDYIGEAGYDIWDSEHLIEENKMYQETGTYIYLIEQHLFYQS